MPPEAFTPQRPPATPRNNETSAGVAPPVENPVEVFKEVASGLNRDLGGAQLLFNSKQASLKYHLKDRAVMMCNRSGCMDGMFDRLMMAALEMTDGENHVEFARIQPGEGGGFVA